MQILQATSHKQRAAIRRPIFPGARPHAPRVSPVGEVEFSDTIGSHRLDEQRLIFAGK